MGLMIHCKLKNIRVHECMQLSTTSSAPRGCTFSRTNFLKFVYSNKLQETGKTTYSAVLSICSKKCCQCLQKCSLQFTHPSMNLFGVMKWLCYGLSNSIPTHCYVSVRSDEGTILSTLLHWVLAVC